MKTTLLIAFGLFTSLNYGQSPIHSYLGEISGEIASFEVVTSETPINQTSGANQSWNFDELIGIGYSVDYFVNPSAAESSEFPGTTRILNTNGTIEESSFAIKILTNGSNLTGINSNGLVLNYATNNANLGAFPMSFGYTHADSSAGTYQYGDYSGTFTGSMNTEVDAFGTLQTNIGSNIQNLAVTRLKTVQNISLNYGFLPNVGTVILTTYSYYQNQIGMPPLVFRTSTISVNVSLLSIDQTATQMENYIGSLLPTQNPEALNKSVTIAPNPASNSLSLMLSGNQELKSVTLTDISGKQVLSVENSQKNIDISNLQKGVYFATITTDSGVITKKILKK